MMQVRIGEVEVLFLLDAYDELSAGDIGKSLYQVHAPCQLRLHIMASRPMSSLAPACTSLLGE